MFAHALNDTTHQTLITMKKSTRSHPNVAPTLYPALSLSRPDATAAAPRAKYRGFIPGQLKSTPSPPTVTTADVPIHGSERNIDQKVTSANITPSSEEPSPELRTPNSRIISGRTTPSTRSSKIMFAEDGELLLMIIKRTSSRDMMTPNEDVTAAHKALFKIIVEPVASIKAHNDDSDDDSSSCSSTANFVGPWAQICSTQYGRWMDARDALKDKAVAVQAAPTTSNNPPKAGEHRANVKRVHEILQAEQTIHDAEDAYPTTPEQAGFVPLYAFAEEDEDCENEDVDADIALGEQVGGIRRQVAFCR